MWSSKTRGDEATAETADAPARAFEGEPQTGGVPRWQQPSSFASRKAQAERNQAQLATARLVSLGESEFVQRDLRSGEADTLPAVLYADLDHPMRRYISVDGSIPQPLFSTQSDPPPQRIAGKRQRPITSRRLGHPHTPVTAAPSPGEDQVRRV